MLPTSGSNYRWRLGDIEITRVLEFEAALFEPTIIHPDVTAEIIERHRGWLEPTLLDQASGLMVFAFHSTVIRTPRATIVVDTCSGNDKERPHKQRYHRKNWPYLANLAAAGFAPGDIDYVLCTHLHADYVGWNTRLIDGRWVPTFPNARYLFARQEWEHWERAELRARYTTDPYTRTACCQSWRAVGRSWWPATMPSMTAYGSSRGPDTRQATCASLHDHRRAP
jgi:glyoxylase-like metal-dependent hydrolase (beta-lactamase superfamily II)